LYEQSAELMAMNWKNKPFRDRSFSAVVEDGDQTRLNAFFKHELAFYNTIVESMESRVRAFPAQVSELSDSQIHAVAELAQLGVNPSLSSSKPIPNRLAEDVKRLPSWLSFVSNSVIQPNLAVLPATRKLMLESFLKFYRHQASILRDARVGSDDEYTLRAPAANLSKQETSTKRHLQIPRSAVGLKWNHEAECSEITIPHCRSAIQAAGVNVNEIQGWDLLIVRQEPGRWVDKQTPWLVEFRNTNNQYLLKLTDTGSRKKIHT
jgi:hypothetical protein